MPPLLLFIIIAVVKDASILASAIMTTSILPLINSCKWLNLFLIELILRYANIGFAEFAGNSHTEQSHIF